MDPHNPQRLLFATYRLYETHDGALTWNVISADVSNRCYAGVTSIAISPVDSNITYVGSECGNISVTTNGLSSLPTWTNRTTSNLPQRDLTSVVADVRSASTAYVTFSGFSYGTDHAGHVFKTTDTGASWTDISGNLPNIPVNHLLVDPDISERLYVATDIGVFATSNSGVSWEGLSAGLPRAYVQTLALHRPTRILRATTLGRGMWELPLVPSPIDSSQSDRPEVIRPPAGSTIRPSLQQR
jgi:photosystem II stability/assembly factor-like uncharacterized protein